MKKSSQREAADTDVRVRDVESERRFHLLSRSHRSGAPFPQTPLFLHFKEGRSCIIGFIPVISLFGGALPVI